MYKPSTLDFLKKLKKNNSKEWFEANRKAYEDALEDHLAFVEKLIQGIGSFEESIKRFKPKDCIFRIYRDVRFSKDKTPYKDHMGAYFAPGGKKDFNRAGYYFHLKPGEAFLAGGIWEPASPRLKQIRQEIDYNTAEFEGILNSAEFRKHYKSLSGRQLQKAPKDYPKEHPAIDLLKYKDYIVKRELTDKDLTSPQLLETCLSAYRALLPLNSFLDRSQD